MSRSELLALKLQMGINPSVRIAPNVLLAMWQQLNFERAQTECKPSPAASNPNLMTFTPIVG
ncbi:MAG: hypothetical protein OEU84_17635 [Xanthomonadales bacterium]|nr:hypothetical protein [Xanthomonadales bacterium]